MEFISHNPKQTQKIASDLAQKIIKTKKGAIIALEGELGAGKTTFIQGFARTFGIKNKIKSPTFVLMKKYKLEMAIKATARLPTVAGNWKLETNLYHLDCYRVKNHKDLKILGLEEILDMSHNSIVLIEWAERVRKILPKKHIKIHIDHIDKNTRKLLITNF